MKENRRVSLTAVGDILLHGRVYGGTNKKSGYDFTNQLKNVSGLLSKTDITVANLETIIGGNEIGLSSFPRFNAPIEIGHTLKEMGVDLVTIANNHVLDKGMEGLLISIKNLKEIGLEYDGAYSSVEDNERLRIFKKNGLKVCFLSYTQSTNGIPVPKEHPYLVNTLKNISLISIVKKIRKIKREKTADVVVVNMHFGSEYHLEPTSRQREIAASLSDAGADVILGHHPHVLQPPEWIENSMGMKTFVSYSLGNFFSGQNGLYRQIGASLNLEIVKPSRKYKGIVVKNPEYTLTFTQREGRRRYGIYLFEDWIKENEYIETADGMFSSIDIYENVKERMKSKIKDLVIH